MEHEPNIFLRVIELNNIRNYIVHAQTAINGYGKFTPEDKNIFTSGYPTIQMELNVTNMVIDKQIELLQNQEGTNGT